MKEGRRWKKGAQNENFQQWKPYSAPQLHKNTTRRGKHRRVGLIFAQTTTKQSIIPIEHLKTLKFTLYT